MIASLPESLPIVLIVVIHAKDIHRHTSMRHTRIIEAVNC